MFAYVTPGFPSALAFHISAKAEIGPASQCKYFPEAGGEEGGGKASLSKPVTQALTHAAQALLSGTLLNYPWPVLPGTDHAAWKSVPVL